MHEVILQHETTQQLDAGSPLNMLRDEYDKQMHGNNDVEVQIKYGSVVSLSEMLYTEFSREVTGHDVRALKDEYTNGLRNMRPKLTRNLKREDYAASTSVAQEVVGAMGIKNPDRTGSIFHRRTPTGEVNVLLSEYYSQHEAEASHEAYAKKVAVIKDEAEARLTDESYIDRVVEGAITDRNRHATDRVDSIINELIVVLGETVPKRSGRLGKLALMGSSRTKLTDKQNGDVLGALLKAHSELMNLDLDYAVTTRPRSENDLKAYSDRINDIDTSRVEGVKSTLRRLFLQGEGFNRVKSTLENAGYADSISAANREAPPIDNQVRAEHTVDVHRVEAENFIARMEVENPDVSTRIIKAQGFRELSAEAYSELTNILAPARTNLQ